MMHKKLTIRGSDLVAAAAAAVIAYLSLTTVYSSDDFGYSLYFEDGLLGYLPLAVEHYKTVNGRALVHLFAHAILALGQWAFCLVCVGSFLLIPYVCQRSTGLDRDGRSLGRSLFLMFVVVMPAGIMTEGVMWQSAFCNYVLPSVMNCCLMMLLRSEQRKWAVVAAFFCGATTEQGGAVAVVVLLLNVLLDLRDRKLRLRTTLAELGCAAVGYATIFLSPSTQGRFLRETSLEESTALLESLQSGLAHQASRLCESPIVAVVVSVVFLAAAWRLRHWGGWLLSAAGTAAVWYGTYVHWTGRLLPWAVVYILLAVMGAVLLWRRHDMEGMLLLAAIASVCIMMPTQSNGCRCLAPIYLYLSMAAAMLAAKSVAGIRVPVKNAALCLLLVCALVWCAPEIRGYWHNYQVDRINASHAEQWEPGQRLPYCMDYDMKYTHSKPYVFGGGFERTYLLALGIDPESTELAYYATGTYTVYVDQMQARFPGIEKDGNVMLPLRTIVETMGGTVKLEGKKIFVELSGVNIVVNNISSGPTEVTWQNSTDRFLCDNGFAGFYLEEAFYTEVLGLRVAYSADGTRIDLNTP